MTLKDLSQLYYLRKLIDRDTLRLSELQARLSPACSRITGMPKCASKKTLEETASLELETQNRIEKQQIEYLRTRLQLEEYINSVGDLQIRLIMSYRFVDLLEWDAVAAKIGGGNTEDSVKKLCYRYIKKSQKSESCPKCPASTC